MVTSCNFPGCKSTTKLLSFPADPVRALRWLQILGLPEDARTTGLKVCILHFSPESFTNYTKAQMGFAVRPHLTEDNFSGGSAGQSHIRSLWSLRGAVHRLGVRRGISGVRHRDCDCKDRDRRI